MGTFPWPPTNHDDLTAKTDAIHGLVRSWIQLKGRRLVSVEMAGRALMRWKSRTDPKASKEPANSSGSAERDRHPGRWVSSIVVAENDMVVQFGTRELTWPGGSFLGFDTPAGTATRDVAFAHRLVDGRIAERWAIRDDLPMLAQLGDCTR